MACRPQKQSNFTFQMNSVYYGRQVSIHGYFLTNRPAREASKQIVADLLNTAGATYTGQDDDSDSELGLAPISSKNYLHTPTQQEDSFDLKL
jgi:hypothetical protein